MRKIKICFLFLILVTVSTFNLNTTHATSDTKEITSFKFLSENGSWNGWWWEDTDEWEAQNPHGIIDGTNITIELPYGMAVTQLIPTISITGVSVSPASKIAQDFTQPVVYTVTAEDNSTQEYKVTVTNHPNSAREITLFSLIPPGSGQENDGVITGTNIAITVPYGTNVTALAPTGINITGASVTPASGVPQDFTNPVIYTVTADDGSTRNYTVTVTIAPSSNLTVLSALITAAQNKYNNAVEGNLIGQYPAPLKANLQTAITTAFAITDMDIQSVVDKAVENLGTAMEIFEAGVNTTPSVPTIPIPSRSGGGSRHKPYVPPQVVISSPIPTPIIQAPIVKNPPKTAVKVIPPKKIAKQVQKPKKVVVQTKENILSKEDISVSLPLVATTQVPENNLTASAASVPVSFKPSLIFKRFLNWLKK